MARVYGRAKLCAVPRSAPFTFHAPYALARKVRNPIFFFGDGGGLFLQKKKKWDILFFFLFTLFCFRAVKGKTVKR